VSFTQSDHVFAGVHEHGINTFVVAFFTARPRYLTYATPSLAPPAPAQFISVSAIPFPGIPGGIQYRARFDVPWVDLFPPDSSTEPLPPGAGELSVRTKVTLTVGCYQYVGKGNDRGGQMTPISTTLEVWARGKPQAIYYGPGNGVVNIVLEDVKILDVKPASLDAVLECVLRMVLQAVLNNLHLPFHALTAGAFQLILTRGPLIEDDQLKMWGTV
jgi:hypothetical protein